MQRNALHFVHTLEPGSPVPSVSSTDGSAAGSSSYASSTELAVVSSSATIHPSVRRRGKQKKPPKSNKLTNREKCKKYREKRKNYVTQLDHDMDRLRQEIVQLGQRHSALLLQSGLPSSHPFLGLVREYYRMFEFGMAKPLMVTCKNVSREQQIRFLGSSMVENLGFGDLNGVKALVEQWSTYGDYHTSLCFELENLQISGSQEAPIVSSNATLHARFSRQTIERVFPHILTNEALVQKMIGRVVSYPCKNQFQFVLNEETGKWRISRYDVQVGFVPALLKACDTLQEVIELMQDAQIVSDHVIGEKAKESLHLETHRGPEIVELVEEEDKMNLDFIMT